MDSSLLQTRIPKCLQGVSHIPLKKICRPFLPSPRTLVELCGEVLNQLRLPHCWTWSVEEVVFWVEKILNFPQYKECFTKNCVNGRKLLYVDACALPRMNICDFEHIKRITAGVRQLFGLELERFSRSVSLTPFPPEQHYLLFRSRHIATRMQLFYRMHLVEEPKVPLDHWDYIIKPYTPQIAGKQLLPRC